MIHDFITFYGRKLLIKLNTGWVVVKLEIVGSASKNPIKKIYSSNTELAKIRVEKGKKYIYDYLKSYGKYSFKIKFIIVKEKAIVSGPKL